MVNFPNCKINLGLHILSRRPDGFHNIETCFFPLPHYDILECIQDAETDSIHVTGFQAGDSHNNICLKALSLLRKDFPEIPAVQIHLHKNISVGAGLGGGSSDGAFMLQMLNRKFSLGIPVVKLLDYSLELGSDCPFFILNKPSLATGRGNVLEEINLDLKGYRVVIVDPGIHISTAEAFSEIAPIPDRDSLRDILQTPVQGWKDSLKNDFEPPMFKKHPALAGIKNELYNSGSEYAAMSGSGSTIFGLFKNMQPQLPKTFSEYRFKFLDL